MPNVIVEDFSDGVTLITINRPERRNAICAQTAIDLQEAFHAFDASPTQRVAVITGAGNDAFSAGADVDSIPELWRCLDRKSTRLNSSHVKISYAVFCLKKKNRLTRSKHSIPTPIV